MSHTEGCCDRSRLEVILARIRDGWAFGILKKSYHEYFLRISLFVSPCRRAYATLGPMTMTIIGKRECEWCDDSSERNTGQSRSFSQGSSEVFHSFPANKTKITDRPEEFRCVRVFVKEISS
jgi:hypothetical protein